MEESPRIWINKIESKLDAVSTGLQTQTEAIGISSACYKCSFMSLGILFASKTFQTICVMNIIIIMLCIIHFRPASMVERNFLVRKSGLCGLLITLWVGHIRYCRVAENDVN